MSDEDGVEVELTDDGPAHIRGNGRTWERGETRTLDPDHADALCEREGFERVNDTCDVEMSSGEICDRPLPCPYHSDGESEED